MVLINKEIHHRITCITLFISGETIFPAHPSCTGWYPRIGFLPHSFPVLSHSGWFLFLPKSASPALPLYDFSCPLLFLLLEDNWNIAVSTENMESDLLKVDYHGVIQKQKGNGEYDGQHHIDKFGTWFPNPNKLKTDYKHSNLSCML